MHTLLDSLPSIAASSSTVLICGEPGVGKKHLARKIHDMGPLKDRPFTSVGCRSMPALFVEGAKNETSTWLREILSHSFKMHSGTCFLDEVGESSAAFQQIILGMLEDRTSGKLPGEAEGPRIIASTSHNLQEMVRAGKFRENLYYRLNVMKLELLPLRLRKIEIATLIDGMISRLNREHNKTIEAVAPEAMARLVAYDWPGNIAELESAIEHCFMVCCGSRIDVEHLPDNIYSSQGCNAGDFLSAAERISYHILTSALKLHAGDFTAAAQEIGMSQAAFARKAQQWGIGC